jgi:hypothetical protein
MTGIPFPCVGGSYTLEELEAKALELHGGERLPDPSQITGTSPRASSRKSPAEPDKGSQS